MLANPGQVTETNSLLANAVFAVALNTNAFSVDRLLLLHTYTACRTTIPMQALAESLNAFAIATALIWAHAHATVRVGPAREAIAYTFFHVAVPMVAAIVQAVCLIAVCPSEALLTLALSFILADFATDTIGTGAVIETLAAAAIGSCETSITNALTSAANALTKTFIWANGNFAFGATTTCTAHTFMLPAFLEL